MLPNSLSSTKPPGSKRYLKSQGIWKPRNAVDDCIIEFASQLKLQPPTEEFKQYAAATENISLATCWSTVQPLQPPLAYQMTEPWEWSLHARLLAWGVYPTNSTKFSHQFSTGSTQICIFVLSFCCVALQHCSFLIPMKNNVSVFIPSLHNFHNLASWRHGGWGAHGIATLEVSGLEDGGLSYCNQPGERLKEHSGVWDPIRHPSL